jgi:serine phosphatase RsbU (regulator of sigma subunit)
MPMFRSLKAKFTVAFGSLIIVLFVALGLFLVQSKANELSGDIAVSTQSFAQFTVSDVVRDFQQYLKPGNFVAFNREINGILRQNTEIAELNIYSYSGDVLYDSAVEQTEIYEGEPRTLEDETRLERVQAQHASVLLKDGSILFVKVDEDRQISYVNSNEEPVGDLQDYDRIVDIIVPYDNAYAVSYGVSYELLQSRLVQAQMQISFAAILGVVLSLLVSYMLSVSITNPLQDLKAGALKIATGDFAARVKVRTKDEIGVLAETFNKMAQDLARSTEAMLYKERVKKELDLASQIQNALLPQEKMQLPSLDLAGGLVPATEIGGDAFDYIPMKDGRLLTYLGDVTGHGVPAGIISSVANAVLYGLRTETDLRNIAIRLNDVMKEKTTNQLFMTMALTVWDAEKSQLLYVNAGHLPLIHYKAAEGTVSEIKVQGMALGLLENVEEKITETVIDMAPGDAIVMVSDGIPEAANAQNLQYGDDRLKRIVLDAAKDLYSAEGIKNAVLSDVVQHMNGASQLDDITIVVMKKRD